MNNKLELLKEALKEDAKKWKEFYKHTDLLFIIAMIIMATALYYINKDYQEVVRIANECLNNNPWLIKWEPKHYYGN